MRVATLPEMWSVELECEFLQHETLRAYAFGADPRRHPMADYFVVVDVPRKAGCVRRAPPAMMVGIDGTWLATDDRLPRRTWQRIIHAIERARATDG